MGNRCSRLRHKHYTRSTAKLPNLRDDFIRQSEEVAQESETNKDMLRPFNRNTFPVLYLDTLGALNRGVNPYTFLNSKKAVDIVIQDVLKEEDLIPCQMDYYDESTCNAGSLRVDLKGLGYGEAYVDVRTDQERKVAFKPIQQEKLRNAFMSVRPELAIGLGGSGIQIPLDVQSWIQVVKACGTTLGEEKHRFVSDTFSGTLNIWAAVHCNLIDANMIRNYTRIKSLFLQIASAALENRLQGMGETYADSVTIFRVKCLPDETLEQTGELIVYTWCDFTHRFEEGVFINNGQLGQLRLVPLIRLADVPVWLAAAIAEGEDPSKEIVTTQILRLNKRQANGNINVMMSMTSDDPAWSLVKLTQFECVESDDAIAAGRILQSGPSRNHTRSNTVKCWHRALKLEKCVFMPHGRNSSDGKDALIATQPQMLTLLASSTHDDIITPAAVFTDFSYWGAAQHIQVTFGDMTYKNASIGHVMETNRGSIAPAGTLVISRWVPSKRRTIGGENLSTRVSQTDAMNGQMSVWSN